MVNLGSTGLLQIEEAMGTNLGSPDLEGLVPNGLLNCHLANQASSSAQHKSPNCTPSSPFRRNGSLDSSRLEPGTKM